MSHPPSPQAILEQSYLVCSKEQIELSACRVAQEINATLTDTPIIVMSVMHGGLYFTAQLLAHLTMPIELDYVHVSRYQHHLSGGALQWIKKPASNLMNKTVLVIDDILDVGITLRGLIDECYALGAQKVYTAVLADKQNGLSKPLQADFVAVNVPDKFVFGCGMDAFGWWRNLPEIRAYQTE